MTTTMTTSSFWRHSGAPQEHLRSNSGASTQEHLRSIDSGAPQEQHLRSTPQEQLRRPLLGASQEHLVSTSECIQGHHLLSQRSVRVLILLLHTSSPWMGVCARQFLLKKNIQTYTQGIKYCLKVPWTSFLSMDTVFGSLSMDTVFGSLSAEAGQNLCTKTKTGIHSKNYLQCQRSIHRPPPPLPQPSIHC